MTYRGQVKDGRIVLEPGASLPEGTDVLVQPVTPPAASDSEGDGRNIWEKPLELSGSPLGLRYPRRRLSDAVAGIDPKAYRRRQQELGEDPAVGRGPW